MLKYLQSFIVLLFYNLIISNIQANQLSCVYLPDDPLHGSLEISGHFMAQVICLDPGKDLPLDAPGEDGNLVCKSNYDNIAEFNIKKIPECLPRRPSTEVRLNLTLYLNRRCCTDDSTVAFPETDVSRPNACMKDLIAEQQSSLNSNVCPSTLCKYTIILSVINTCAKEQTTGNALIILIKTHAAYSSKELSKYNAIHEKAVAWAAKMTVDQDHILHVDVGDWEAVCPPSVSAGTRIRFHEGLASCRGCRATYYKMNGQRRCIKCDFGFYNTKPYQSYCMRCDNANIPEGKMKEWCYEGRN